jgi:hypothetical protein
MKTTILENGLIECYFKALDVTYLVDNMDKAILIGMALGYYNKQKGGDTL